MKSLFNNRSSRMIMVFLLFVSTRASIYAQDLPAEWQPDMRLTTSYGGVMRDQTDSVVILNGRSYERHRGMDNNTSRSYVFSAGELNKLLAFLKTKNFDKMQSQPRPGIVDDMGSSTIILQWGNHVVGISSSATQIVPALYEKDLNDIYAYIGQMMAAKRKHGAGAGKK